MKAKFLTVSIAVFCLLGRFSFSADDSVPKNWLGSINPFRIAGPIYYVGTEGLGVYLIKSNNGLILLSGAMPQSAGMISDSIRSLGFKTSDIRMLLVSHAHIDHVGTLAEFKKITGAKVVAMHAEDALLKSGGKTDYLFGNRPALHFVPINPDQLIQDGESVVLGDIRLTAIGHPDTQKVALPGK